MPFWSISSFWVWSLLLNLLLGILNMPMLCYFCSQSYGSAKKYIKVQNKTKINAAYDNVKYFFSCRKIFFLFKVSRMDMYVPLLWWHISWCVLEQVRCPLLSSLQPRRNLACPAPGAAHSTGAGDRLVVQCALHTRGGNIHNIQRRRLWNGLLLSNWIWIYHKLTPSKHDLCT